MRGVLRPCTTSIPLPSLIWFPEPPTLTASAPLPNVIVLPPPDSFTLSSPFPIVTVLLPPLRVRLSSPLPRITVLLLTPPVTTFAPLPASTTLPLPASVIWLAPFPSPMSVLPAELPVRLLGGRAPRASGRSRGVSPGSPGAWCPEDGRRPRTHVRSQRLVDAALELRSLRRQQPDMPRPPPGWLASARTRAAHTRPCSWRDMNRA